MTTSERAGQLPVQSMPPVQSVARGEVPEAFDEVADRYDLMVALNPGYHAHLRRSADTLVEGLPPVSSVPGEIGHTVTVVDLGCGSGASTRAVVAALEAAGRRYRLVGVDGSAGMLREARSKSWPDEVSFAQGRAERLGDVAALADVADGGIDAVFAAYLVRNVTERDALLTSLRGVLRPGGALVVHEYSVAGNRRATAIWTAVCWSVVVPLGYLTSRRTRLYRYLWQSVLEMDSVQQLMGRLRDAGFEDVRSRSTRGWQRGIIHTFHGRRPLA
ncbi:class I SAM-dependent methyltransferase [Terracoccus luteus]|jgi:ubiquinone/menaquinone biosynthesis C-methylase UbiE|uniref:Ubiquinone/menaquinone biosynthesis C-methylase UbiE n=1 Tax=Terracoccus luteus TaxID=53356 RepID=A0A839PUD7_9MICO|nr:class I SAM-dependent methyltransferase [Terracoccus luteus]MBB2986809.1 ubiquinone/menaquinone biosynthesis C-methylase UbiE [Terracoccus luteus]MCP2172460.1 ubiquinone/menaquinone biosynthesis C-methylase UbiE [Terracoccus luteus]